MFILYMCDTLISSATVQLHWWEIYQWKHFASKGSWQPHSHQNYSFLLRIHQAERLKSGAADKWIRFNGDRTAIKMKSFLQNITYLNILSSSTKQYSHRAWLDNYDCQSSVTEQDKLQLLPLHYNNRFHHKTNSSRSGRFCFQSVQFTLWNYLQKF